MSGSSLAIYTLLCAIGAAPWGLARAGEELTLRERLAGLRVGAHQGGYQFADSNTIERFEKAAAQGADIVETDLQASSDGVPFLFHDAYLDPDTECSGRFASAPAAMIEACNLVGLKHGAQRFEDALAWSRGRIVIDAEFNTPDVIRPAIDLVRRYAAYEWVYFQIGEGEEFYDQARAYDPYVALEAVPAGKEAQSTLDHLLARNDPRLISVQIHPDLATSANLQAIARAGKLISADAFRFGTEHRWAFWPFRTAFCSGVYRLGVNIAVSNVPDSCAAQRNGLGGQFLSISVTR
jgi:glycerophosphoryl diester phosphodiesterase